MDQSFIFDRNAQSEERWCSDEDSCLHCSMLTVEVIHPRPPRDSEHEFASKAFHDQCTNCQVYNSHPKAACDFCKHLRLGHWFRCILPSLDNERHGMERSPYVKLDVSNHFAQKPESDCDLCRFFQGAFKHPIRKLEIKIPSSFRDDFFSVAGGNGEHRAKSTIAVQAPECPPIALHRKLRKEVDWDTVKTWGLGPSKVSGLPSKSRVVDPYGLNFDEPFVPHMEPRKDADWDTIKSWDIGPSKVSGLPVGFTVIDLDRRCLVEALNHPDYVALSYVWGGSIDGYEELQATKNNIELLKEPGMLSKFHLPSTITDAMTACQELGFQYLWVDRLCIVQDDENNEYHKDDQIDSMDLIYESSSVTIVAASGESARDGIAGISRHRDDPHPVLRWEELELIAPFPSLDSILAETKWSSRGWTFQERICATTAMFFTDHGVFAVFDKSERRSTSLLAERSARYWMTDEEVRTYFTGVEEYTRRSLTLHTDILYAFNGAARRLHCGRDIIHGIPLLLFDDAILWQPAQWNMEVRPPDSSGKQAFPSWAWCSFHGPVTHTSPSANTMVGICASLASWAFPGSSGALIPVPFAPFMLEYPYGNLLDPFQSHTGWHVKTMNFAWREGFFKREYFTSERRDQHRGPFEGDIMSTIRGKPLGREHLPRLATERGVCHSGNPDPVFLSSFSTEDKMRACAKPGRILVFTQRASLELEYLSTIAFKRVFALWSPKGRWMGLIGLTRSIADMHVNSIQAGGRLQMDFLALSITSDYDTIWATAKELNMNTRRRDDGTWEPQTGGKQEKENIDGWVEREGIRSMDSMDYQINNMAGDYRNHYDSWAMHEAEVSFTNRGRELHRPLFATTDDTIARVNVMLISQKDGVARRLGVGQVYIKRWKEANREFCTTVLE